MDEQEQVKTGENAIEAAVETPAETPAEDLTDEEKRLVRDYAVNDEEVRRTIIADYLRGLKSAGPVPTVMQGGAGSGPVYTPRAPRDMREAALPNLKNLLKNVDKSKASAAFVNGKYYLACRMDYGDGETIGCEGFAGGYINNTILELDVKTLSCNLHRGIDAVHLCAVKTGTRSIVAACVNDGEQGRIAEIAVGENLTGDLKRVWTTPLTDLGTPKTKLLKEITVQSGKDMVLRISTESETKDITVRGGGQSRVRAGISGKLIQASFISEGGGVRIASPRLSFDILDR